MNSGQSFLDNIDIEQLSSKDKALLAKVWQSSGVADSSLDTISSGHPKLDNILANKGWPLGVSTEIGLSQPGIGEIRLLMPALRALQQRSSSMRNVIWVAPPCIPLASSLIQEGLDLNQLTIVESKDVEHAIWAAEQALLSNSCAAVILWTDKQHLSNKILRRLQLAVEKSGSWNLILRHESCLQQASVSHLRLCLNVTPLSELQVHILKQPNSWGNQSCTLSLPPHYEHWQRLPVGLLPHNNRVLDQLPTNVKPSLEKESTINKATSVTTVADANKATSVSIERVAELRIGLD